MLISKTSSELYSKQSSSKINSIYIKDFKVRLKPGMAKVSDSRGGSSYKDLGLSLGGGSSYKEINPVPEAARNRI